MISWIAAIAETKMSLTYIVKDLQKVTSCFLTAVNLCYLTLEIFSDAPSPAANP